MIKGREECLILDVRGGGNSGSVAAMSYGILGIRGGHFLNGWHRLCIHKFCSRFTVLKIVASKHTHSVGSLNYFDMLHAKSDSCSRSINGTSNAFLALTFYITNKATFLDSSLWTA
jgi:hypothetical protein